MNQQALTPLSLPCERSMCRRKALNLSISALSCFERDTFRIRQTKSEAVGDNRKHTGIGVPRLAGTPGPGSSPT